MGENSLELANVKQVRETFLGWLYSSSFRIWLLFFLYALCTGFLVQLFVLPYLFPALHAGEGLLKGGDWLYFHALAKNLAERMRTEGLGVWELRPEGQAPAGIAALLYFLFGPKPWVVLPLNSFVHACGGLVLFFFIRDFVKDARIAFFASLPFVFFPSAMNWYAQMHKDGIFALGVLLFLWGWSRFLQEEEKSWLSLLVSLGITLGGALTIWIVRPYAVEILWFLSILLSLALSVVVLFSRGRKKAPWLALLFFWLVVTGLTSIAYFEKPSAIGLTSITYLEKLPEKPSEKLPEKPSEKPSTYPWYDTWWVPSFLEGKLRGLAEVRNMYRFIDPDAMGNIDWEVTFHSAGDILKYTPRALVIGFLAPFPEHWFQEGTSPGGSIKRKICGFEMVIAYAAFLFIPCFLWSFRKNVALWVTLFYSLLMVLIFTLAFPNLGPLYRERYGFFMTLVALGIAGWLNIASRRKLSSSK